MSDPTVVDGFIVVGILIAALVLVAGMLFRPKPTSRVMYVPIEVETHQDRFGCGPAFALVLLVSGVAAIITLFS